MPICQICRQKQATVHYTRIVNGQKVEMHVCEQCARENSEIKLNLHKLLSGIMGQDASNEIKNAPVPAMKCKTCGMTAEEFNRTGLLGCADCYETFGESIQILLKRIHGNVRHHGKTPKKLAGKINQTRSLLSMKEELQKCILEENYEQAAILRDKIREAEKLQRG